MHTACVKSRKYAHVNHAVPMMVGIGSALLQAKRSENWASAWR